MELEMSGAIMAAPLGFIRRGGFSAVTPGVPGLKSAKVAKTITYRGQTIKKGKHVKLKPDGSIESIK